MGFDPSHGLEHGMERQGGGARRIEAIRTSSDDWLRRHRETHERHAAFGTHRHPYLVPRIRELATGLARGGEAPSLLDYGCGKGAFLREMSGTGLFRFVRGYDPALDRFKARPAQAYDMVVCLDVLDQLEPPFVEPAIRDVAQFAGRVALFSLITVQTPAMAHLRPRSAQTWAELIGGAMRVVDLTVRAATAEELAQGAAPERAILVAEPLA